MQTISDDRFAGDPWDALSKRVQEHAAPWLNLLREYEQEYDALGEADGEGGLCSFLKHILWLVPLAQVLQQRAELHGLYPLVHHAVIELKRLPHSIPQHECFTYYAQAECVFKLSFDVRQSNPLGWQSQELGRGDAEQVAQVLVDVVQPAMVGVGDGPLTRKSGSILIPFWKPVIVMCAFSDSLHGVVNCAGSSV